VNEERAPAGNTDGEDCDLIDPLVLTFTISMTYVTLYSDVSLDDIVALPFEKKRQQKKYAERLRENDASGAFGGLRCASGPRVPGAGGGGGGGGGAPDGAADDVPVLRSHEALDDQPAPVVVRERRCDERLQKRTTADENLREFEVSFAYAVEYTTSEARYLVNILEEIILDFVAASVLRCSGGDHLASARTRKSLNGHDATREEARSVVRIRYPEEGEITSVSSCDPTSPRAKECYVLDTGLLVAVAGGGPAAPREVHRDVLAILKEAFDADAFARFVPEMEASSYLGPRAPSRPRSRRRSRRSARARERTGRAEGRTIIIPGRRRASSSP